MKTGDLVGRYRITQPFTNAGGGQSEWTFAERDGTSYFLKRFLKPTYPVEGAPGSERVKDDKRKRCLDFEEHHQGIRALLAPLSASGGNLVVCRDFFRHGAHYYKVTERIDNATMLPATLAAMPLHDLVPLLVGVANSLGILHRKGLVHGDVKPDNLLLKKGANGVYATKLIDFDDCFRTGAPPEPEDMVGDPAHYSPEITAYLNGEGDGTAITEASDVFALGLVFVHYLTDTAPGLARRFAQPSTTGEPDPIPLPAGREALAPLLASMLHPEAETRPTLPEVAEALKRARKGYDHRATPSRRGDPGLRISENLTPGPAPGLVGKGLRIGAAATGPGSSGLDDIRPGTAEKKDGPPRA